MKLFKRFLLIWMIAWLPAAGAMAVVMPLSAAVVASSAGSEADASLMPCHGSKAAGKTNIGEGCTHCVLCHLAGALILPTLPFVAALLPTHVYTAEEFVVHPSFIPELTAPPPRFALA